MSVFRASLQLALPGTEEASRTFLQENHGHAWLLPSSPNYQPMQTQHISLHSSKSKPSWNSILHTGMEAVYYLKFLFSLVHMSNQYCLFSWAVQLWKHKLKSHSGFKFTPQKAPHKSFLSGFACNNPGTTNWITPFCQSHSTLPHAKPVTDNTRQTNFHKCLHQVILFLSF